MFITKVFIFLYIVLVICYNIFLFSTKVSFSWMFILEKKSVVICLTLLRQWVRYRERKKQI